MILNQVLFRNAINFAGMNYELPIIEEQKTNQTTTLHLICALIFIGAGAIIAIYNFIISAWGIALCLAGFILLILTIAKNKWITKSNINLIGRIKELLISLTIGFYSITQHWKFPSFIFCMLSVTLIFALIWENKSKRNKFISIDEGGVYLPFPERKRKLEWHEITDIIIRYGTLTIECTDNRFYQWEVQLNNIVLNEFELFCKQSIEANIGKRGKDEW